MCVGSNDANDGAQRNVTTRKEQAMKAMKNDYFAAAKKAAKKKIADPSAAHAAAIKVLRKMVPGKPEAFYGDGAWQAVLAARE